MQTTVQRLLRIAQRVPELRSGVFHEIVRRGMSMRDVYLPSELRGKSPTVPEGTDLAVWTWEEQGVPYAIVFAGKANKPVWYHRFRNEADRQRHIDQESEGRRRVLRRKQERVEERRSFQHNLKKGDILYSSWGYDQTNVDFYEVTDTSEKSVTLRQIGKKTAGPHGDRVIPVPNHFTGAPLRKVPQGGGGRVYVKITSHSNAYPWDGKPLYQTPFGMGH